MLKLSPVREKGRVLAAQLIAAARLARCNAGDPSCTDRSITRHWQQNSPDKVAAFFRPESGKAIAFGDVLALPRELARDILVRALAALDQGPGMCPRETVDRLAIELGRATDLLLIDVADGGRIASHHKHAASFSKIASIALRGQSAAERAARGDEP